MNNALDQLVIILLVYGGIILASGLGSRLLVRLVRRRFKTDKLDESASRLSVGLVMQVGIFIVLVALGIMLVDSANVQEESLQDVVTVFLALPIIFLIVWREILQPFGEFIWKTLQEEKTEHE